MSDPTMTVNRESWLHKAAGVLSPLLVPHNAIVPEKLQISCSWPRKGKRNAIGQCWPKVYTQDETTHVFISPVLGHDVTQVLDTLLHELIHAACGTECGHKGRFKTVARAVGLEGKLTATVAGAPLKEKLVEMADGLGPYPHSVILGLNANLPAMPKVAGKSIMLRSGEDPNYFIQMSRAMYEEYGSPLDPWGNELILAQRGRPKKNKDAE